MSVQRFHKGERRYITSVLRYTLSFSHVLIFDTFHCLVEHFLRIISRPLFPPSSIGAFGRVDGQERQNIKFKQTHTSGMRGMVAYGITVVSNGDHACVLGEKVAIDFR